MDMQSEHIGALAEAIPDVISGRFWTVLARYPEYLIGQDGTVVSGISKRALKPIRRGEYYGFTLRDRDGILRPVYHHRIVAEAWHGPCPDGHECRHIDGDRAANTADNVAWGTHQENVDDTSRHGNTLLGEKNPMAALTRAAVAEMRLMRATTSASYAAIGRKFNVSPMTAYRAVERHSWK